MTELYLDGYRLELQDTAISQTYQINDIAEVENRQSSYTNQFNIPATPLNVMHLDMLGVAGNTSRKPYKKIPAKLVENGIELMSNAYAVIASFTGYYKVTIYDGNVSLSEALDGKTLSDLDYSSLNHYNDFDTFKNSFSNETGYVHALADYGKEGSNYYNTDYNTGAIFVQWLWDKIFSEAGLEYSGDFFDKNEFEDLVCTPVRGFELSNDPETEIDLGSIETNEISDTGSLTSTGVSIDEYFEYTGSLSQITNNTNHLTFDYTGLCKISLAGSLLCSVTGGVEVLQKRIVVELNGSMIKEFTGETIADSLIINVAAGDDLAIKVEAIITPNTGAGDYNFSAELDMTFDDVVIRNYIDYSDLMPDTSQIDFIKDIMQRFGLMFRRKRNSNEYQFIEFEELLKSQATANDWSSKLVSWTEDYQLSNYAQKNTFAHAYDDGVEAFADGYMDIDNETLDAESTILTSLFTASQVSKFIEGVPVHNVPLWAESEENEETVWNVNEDTLRIFRLSYSGSAKLKTDASSNIVEVSGIVPNLLFSPCSYSGLITNHYAAYADLLNDYNKTTAYLMLDAVDIYNLNFFKLIYLEQLGSYFYLNKVTYKGTPTSKCELIKL